MATRNWMIVGMLAAFLAGPALAQQSPVSAPPPGESDSHVLPGLSSSKTSVEITPDPSATPMADPQSAAMFGSPSAVESPSSPMPNSASWPAIKPSAKRPKWVQKAPPPGMSAAPAKSAPGG